MNGYDFDETILKGNSVRSFYIYCLARLPYMIIYLPVFAAAAILNALHWIGSDAYYNMLTFYVKLVPNKQKMVKKFWDRRISKIKRWYLNQRRDDDLIISASPSYIVEEACSRLKVTCIATPVDLATCKVLGGKHCYGAAKPDFYKEQYGDTPLNTFYSDSWSDEAMFKIAKRGYLVKGDKIWLVYEDGVRLDKKDWKRVDGQTDA